ncbi:MAG: DUF2254 family protein [Bacteroidota bacterium]
MLSLLYKFLNSIALVPAILLLCFLCLALGLVHFEVDYEQYEWLHRFIISDPSDIQFALSFVIGGIFTLTIFSYTMVMNVINRNINNYSPRLIPLLLSENHHQVILGFSTGTIIFAMTLSLALNADYQDYFPNIAAALAVIFAMICVMLFIYFIHSVSQSIHINHILYDVFQRTSRQIASSVKELGKHNLTKGKSGESYVIHAERTGYLHRYELDKLLKYANNADVGIVIHKMEGAFVHKGEKLLSVSESLVQKKQEQLLKLFVINHEVPFEVPEVGCKHLVEVAVKACSPALNDPGTALTSLQYLTSILIQRLNTVRDRYTSVCIDQKVTIPILPTAKLMERSYREMYQYMYNDPILRSALRQSKMTIARLTKYHG